MCPYSTALIIRDPSLRQELRAALAGYPVRVLLEGETVGYIESRRPTFDIVFVDAEPAQEPITELVERFAAAKRRPLIVAVVDAARPESAIAAFRAGAGDVLIPPLRDGLRAIMERAAEAVGRRAPDTEARQVAFVGAKGGCGTTTLACHVASSVNATTPMNVLLVDLDFSAGLSGFLLKTGARYTIVDAALNAYRLDESLWRGYVTSCGPRFDMLPSPISTVPREEVGPDSVREALRTAGSLYGWVIADFGRGLNPFSAELITGFDDLCVVTTPDFVSVYQAGQVIEHALECGVPRDRIRLTVNQTHPRQVMQCDEIERSLKRDIFAAIPYRTGIEEAYVEGRLMHAGSDFGRDCARLAKKLAGAPEPDAAPLGRWSLQGGKGRAAGVEAI